MQLVLLLRTHLLFHYWGIYIYSINLKQLNSILGWFYIIIIFIKEDRYEQVWTKLRLISSTIDDGTIIVKCFIDISLQISRSDPAL